MVLLVLRHTLPIIIRGAGDYSLTLFMVRLGLFCLFFVLQGLQFCLGGGAKEISKPELYMQLLVLRTIGILLPIYVMVKAFTAIQRRRHQQVC